MKSSDTLLADLSEGSPGRLLVVLWGGLAVVDVGRLAGAPPGAVLAGLAVLVAACSVRAACSTTLLAAGVAWLVFNGFVVNALGTLQVHGPAELGRGALLVLAAFAGREAVR